MFGVDYLAKVKATRQKFATLGMLRDIVVIIFAQKINKKIYLSGEFEIVLSLNHLVVKSLTEDINNKRPIHLFSLFVRG